MASSILSYVNLVKNELTNNHGSIFRHENQIVIHYLFPDNVARAEKRKKIRRVTTTLIKKKYPLTVKIDMNFI